MNLADGAKVARGRGRTSPSAGKVRPKAPHQCVEPLADADVLPVAATEVEPGAWDASADPDSLPETLRGPAVTLWSAAPAMLARDDGLEAGGVLGLGSVDGELLAERAGGSLRCG